MTRRRTPLLVVLFLSLSGCVPEGSAGPSDPPPVAEPSSDRRAFLVKSPAGRTVATIPVPETNLDRLEVDLREGDGAVVAALSHGETGGASLLLIDPRAGGRQTVLLRTSPREGLGRPLWSPSGGAGFAVVVQREPVRTAAAAGGEPTIAFRGDLLVGSAGGTLHRLAPSVEDASRILGWIDEDTLLVARALPGDFPQETLVRVDVPGGAVRQLPGEPVPGTAGVRYGITLLGDRLVHVRAAAPFLTAPAEGQPLELVVADLDGRALLRHPLRPGVMPFDFALEEDGETLRYRVEGSGEVEHLSLGTGGARIEPGPGGRIPRIPHTGQLASLSMPYIHQVYDTPDSFNGNWACGPTSTVMAICHFGRLKTWPITVSVPTSHTSDYGAYVAEKYTVYGNTFDRMQTDASGNAAYGGYGWCTESGAAWAWRMQDYAKKHSLSSDFTSTISFSAVKQEIDNGKVVVLSTYLTSSGHLITVKGTTSSGELVVNDPYGDKNLGYKNYKGEGAVYTWAQTSAKWYINVYGSIYYKYKASVVKTSYPTTMASGSTKDASITYKNEGTETWGTNTRLGTTEPQDRASSFYTSGSWISTSRVVAAPASTAQGSQATFAFKLTAPKVCKSTTYTEHFNLVEEKTAWFSDSDQGGPTDKEVAFTISVTADPSCTGADGGSSTGDSGPATDSSDGAAPNPVEGGGGGCGCTVAAAPSRPEARATVVLVLVIALVLGRRARRSRASNRSVL
jgi:hypothetical protein